MASVKNAAENKLCHDCGKKIEVENGQILDAFFLEYDDNGNKIGILKCRECFEKDNALRNFRSCEVYSRVCGYLRPVNQWNVGKRREFEDREEYRI